MTKKHMIFIVIPKGKFPKTRKHLAKDTGNKSLMIMDNPVYYADEDSRLAYPSIMMAKICAAQHGKIPRFVEAGK
jgi:hypothetical protein